MNKFFSEKKHRDKKIIIYLHSLLKKAIAFDFHESYSKGA